MQSMEIPGLIERDQSTSRYVLTDTGRAVFRVLRGTKSPTCRLHRRNVARPWVQVSIMLADLADLATPHYQTMEGGQTEDQGSSSALPTPA